LKIAGIAEIGGGTPSDYGDSVAISAIPAIASGAARIVISEVAPLYFLAEANECRYRR